MNKNINFNKNETESKKENPTLRSRKTNLVLQLIEEPLIKSTKYDEMELAVEKRGHFLYRIFFLKEAFFNMYRVLNTLSGYTYFYTLKRKLPHTFM